MLCHEMFSWRSERLVAYRPTTRVGASAQRSKLIQTWLQARKNHYGIHRVAWLHMLGVVPELTVPKVGLCAPGFAGSASVICIARVITEALC